MKTLKITAKDLDKNNKYIGKEELSDWGNPFDGNIEIDENLGYVNFEKSLVVSGSIVAKAGSGIKAGWGIKAGSGIEAGLSIICKLSLSFKYNLFAGTAWWKKAEGEDKKVKCGKLEGGTVCYGDLEETGLPEEKKSLSGKVVKVTIDNEVYEATIK